MNTASKLALLCALALAAMAVASASALAQTTVTPTGAWTATEAGPGTLDNGTFTITCDASTAAGTVDNNTTPSRATITTLTFSLCTSNLGACTVSVTTLPASLNVVHVATTATTGGATTGTTAGVTTGATAGSTQATTTTPTAVLTLVATESATITCGAVTCTATADTTLHLVGFNTPNGTAASLHVVDQEVALSGDLACGTAPGGWNSVWTITSNGGDLVVEV
jgi:hypothetical protein